MAIFHFSAKIVSRASGQSAIAAAAYRSGEKLTSEYDGAVHDYTRKSVERGVVMLPEDAPREYISREILWNSVEMNEKQSNAQLAREIEFSLPIELDESTRERIALEFIQENFVNDGMIADVCFHDPPKRDSHGRPINAEGKITSDPEEYIRQNPHCHVMLTMRPISGGKWEAKNQKLYVCERDGERRSFTPEELKKNPGWEKLYNYGGKWLTKSAAGSLGLSQTNRYPKSEHRLNPKVERWNAPETLVKWRAAWAEKVNSAFKEIGISQRIDYRSYAEQGLDLIPTIHEGRDATVENKRLAEDNMMTDIRALNEAIREHNNEVRMVMEIRDLRRRLETLMEDARKRIITAGHTIAETLEKLRAEIIATRVRYKRTDSALNETDERIRLSMEFIYGMDAETKDIVGAEIDRLKIIAVKAKERLTDLAARIARLKREYIDTKRKITSDMDIDSARLKIRPDIEKEYSAHVGALAFEIESGRFDKEFGIVKEEQKMKMRIS